MTDRCVHCGAELVATDRFCEQCGVPSGEVRRVAIPGPSEDGPCTGCGNATFVDGYCDVCGQRRTGPDREQAALDGIVLISDRGIEHAGNEDSAAAGVVAEDEDTPPYAVAAAVCDGVSSSAAAHTAAIAAAQAGVEAMLTTMVGSRNAKTAVVAGLVAAAKAAAAAGAGIDAYHGPSCTYAGAAVLRTSPDTVHVVVGNVGDSRVYWLPVAPAEARCLTIDDSVAQALITAGAKADSEAVQRGAHTLTRWLGADAGPTPWSDTSVSVLDVSEPGTLLLCTDGLWNYLPDADDLARLCAGIDAVAAARALVDHALAAGGEDNITVVLIPIGGSDDFA